MKMKKTSIKNLPNGLRTFGMVEITHHLKGLATILKVIKNLPNGLRTFGMVGKSHHLKGLATILKVNKKTFRMVFRPSEWLK